LALMRQQAAGIHRPLAQWLTIPAGMRPCSS
jgi:hypothetical protein